MPQSTAPADLQALCEQGSEKLIAMDYLGAEADLAAAEAIAWGARDFDSLSRLYMPLQEARRQRRQRCGEGVVRLDLLASSADDRLDPERLADEFPQGQLLVAGWGTTAPAARLRQIQRDRRQFAETFLGAVYPILGGSRAVVIAPLVELALPPARELTIDALLAALPPHSIVMHENELPRGNRAGTYETYGEVMAMWEKLHLPYLAAADMQADPVQKIEHYRRTIRVDYACELAHQKLSQVAHELTRPNRGGAR